MSTRLLSAELRRCTLVFCTVLFAGSFASAQTSNGSTRLLRTPTVSATQIAFAYAQNIWVVPRAARVDQKLGMLGSSIGESEKTSLRIFP